jgi:hypothetical protein
MSSANNEYSIIKIRAFKKNENTVNQIKFRVGKIPVVKSSTGLTKDFHQNVIETENKFYLDKNYQTAKELIILYKVFKI